MDWPRLGNYLYGNRAPIILGVTAIGTALVKTAPPPGQPFNLYEWAYDFWHQFLNITNTRMNTTPTITPPSPAEPTKPEGKTV